MSPVRAPLFSVSLAFATGCVLGLDNGIGPRAALAIFAGTGVLWLLARRHEAASLGAFYAFTAGAGLAYAQLRAHTIAPDDLRRLPETKLMETTQWRGIVQEEPASQATPHASRRALDRTTFLLRVEAWRPTGGRFFSADIDAPWLTATGAVACTVVGPAGDLRLGDRLEFAAALEPISPALCPGQFDARDFNSRQGLYYDAVLLPDNWRRLEIGRGDWLARLSYAARDWAYSRLQIGLEDDPRMADFLAGMLIGYRQQIPADIEQDFRRTGTIHVFAVSGQNIAEMVVVVLVLLQMIGLVRWRWAWTVAPVVLAYCLMTGSPASAVRATAMALAVLLAWRLGRPLNALAGWSLAFLAMMIWSPQVLLDPGAQLSFALVLSLILLAPPIMRMLMHPMAPDPLLPKQLWTDAERYEHRFWQFTALTFGSGIAAALVCEPITAVDFHQITPISILANLFVVPMAGLITVVGTLSIFVSAICPPVTALLNNANWLFAAILIWFVHLLAHQPGAMINVPDVAAFESPRPSLVVAPLRDGACLLVRGTHGAWLINTGRESVSPSTVWHLLQYYGVNRLDGLVLAELSGPDNSGAEDIVRDFHPRRLVVPVLRTKSPLEKEVGEIAALPGTKLETWQAGDDILLEPRVRAEVLHPAAESPETHADDRGLVILFHVGNQSLLWAGRIGPETCRRLLAAHPDLRADVLVMGTERPPESAWLSSLQVRDWLQVSPRDERANVETAGAPPDFCKVWPLEKTGSVEIHFQDAGPTTPGKIMLRPWVALPAP